MNKTNLVNQLQNYDNYAIWLMSLLFVSVQMYMCLSKNTQRRPSGLK